MAALGYSRRGRRAVRPCGSWGRRSARLRIDGGRLAGLSVQPPSIPAVPWPAIALRGLLLADLSATALGDAGALKYVPACRAADARRVAPRWRASDPMTARRRIPKPKASPWSMALGCGLNWRISRILYCSKPKRLRSSGVVLVFSVGPSGTAVRQRCPMWSTVTASAKSTPGSFARAAE